MAGGQIGNEHGKISHSDTTIEPLTKRSKTNRGQSGLAHDLHSKEVDLSKTRDQLYKEVLLAEKKA